MGHRLPFPDISFQLIHVRKIMEGAIISARWMLERNTIAPVNHPPITNCRKMARHASKFIHVTRRTKVDVPKFAIRNLLVRRKKRKRKANHSLAHVNQDSYWMKMVLLATKFIHVIHQRRVDVSTYV